MKSKIAVIIVEYNTPDRCLRYISELKKASDIKDINFVVVDNYMDCDNGVFFDDAGEDVTYFRSETNAGFAAANNIGAGIANEKYDPEYYLISNSDISFPKELELSKLIEVLEKHEDAAAVGPKVSSPSGTGLSPSKYVSLFRKHILANILWPFNLFIPSVRRKNKSIIDYPSDGICYYVAGAFMLTKREAFLKAGGFDTGTFLYAEEAILAERFLKHGMHEYYCSNAEIIHEEGGTTTDKKKSELKNLLIKRKRVFESEMYYYRKYMGEKESSIKLARLCFKFFAAKLSLYTKLKRQ